MLRGIAAGIVVFQHAAEYKSLEYRIWSTSSFRPGEMGVILFFLVSGFIVPVSLERYRTAERFWVSRFFRLFPPYWFAMLVALALHAIGRYPIPGVNDIPGGFGDRTAFFASNIAMVPEFFRQALVLGNAWTLGFELIFYVLVTAFFLARVQGRSREIALVWIVGAAVVGMLSADALPNLLQLGPNGARSIAVLISIGAAAAVAYIAKRNGGASVRAAALTLGAGLFFVNRGPALWFACLLLMTMFVGTVMYRATVGELSWITAWLIYAAALGAIVLAHMGSFTVYADPLSGAVLTQKAELLTFAVAYGLFGLGVLLRHLPVPKVLSWFGLISYSLYLSHPIIINAVPAFDPSVSHHAMLTVAAWLACSVAAAAFSYYVIEKPFMQLGKAMARRVGRPPTEPARTASEPPVH